MAQTEKSTTRLNVIRLSDVQVEEVQWLWKPYLPIGKVTILEGDPESGKSYLSLTIAAHVTRGKGLPAYGSQPGDKRKPRNVLLLAGEDGTADTVKPRLLKVGGDDKRMFQLRGIVKTQNGKDVELGITLDSVDLIDQALEEYKPELVIVDPFQSFLGSHIDMHRANEMRPVLDGLAKLAAKHGCAIVLIRHLSKDNSRAANQRGIGSVDIYAAARSVLLAGKNPLPPSTTELLKLNEDNTRCVFAQSKCSLAKSGPSIAYTIGEAGLTLDGPVMLTADDILNTGPKLSQRPDIEQWLTKFLADGPKPAAEVKQAGKTQSFSDRQLDHAASRLGVNRKPGGFGKGWVWSLQTEQQQTETKPEAAA
jgi:putative DNA primase/helicase